MGPPQGGLPSGPMGGTGGGASGGVGALGGAVGGTGALGGLLGGGASGGNGAASDAGAVPSADAGPSDAGVGEAGVDGAAADAGPGDGALPTGDAGLCLTQSSARADGGCQGSYCSLTLDALADFTSPGGACSGDRALRLACDAQLARKTAQCAQDNVLALSLESAVRSCLRRDPQLSEVGGSCVDCYVEELMCTLSNCLATCVAGFDVACTSCRRESCGPAFTRCSGLPGL